MIGTGEPDITLDILVVHTKILSFYSLVRSIKASTSPLKSDDNTYINYAELNTGYSPHCT